MSEDRRTTLRRDDLAAAALEGMARARRFLDPVAAQVTAPSAAVRPDPDEAAEQVDQVLFGEIFDILLREGEHVWGQARRDGYVGFLRADALSLEPRAPTHRVAVPRTFAFARPSIKAPARGPFGLNALGRVIDETSTLLHIAGAGWMPRAHLAPIGSVESDWPALAERFLGVPYLWGGRDGGGLDCSGLVQQALLAAGIACPRDTDQQAALGRPAPAGDAERGDLVFWRGHVGVMLDAERLLHANAHHMAVAVEPLETAITRIRDAGAGEPLARRRLGRVPQS